MFDYLQQFNRLAKELRDSVSSSEAMKSLDEIEAKYGVKLASVVMRIMVKDLPLLKLPLFLASEFSLNEEDAKKIVDDLKNSVFKKVSSYLGFVPVIKPENLDDKISNILQAGALSFASQNLVDRFKSAAKTYLHGVRGKIDTRLILQKSVDAGGLGLSTEKTDQILALLDGNLPPVVVAKKSSALDDLIAKSVIQPEYSLAAAIEERKKKLLAKKELQAGEDVLDFPLHQTQKDLPLPENLPFAELKKEIPKLSKIEVPVVKKDDEIASPEEIEAFLKKISQNQQPEETVKPVEEKISAPTPVTKVIEEKKEQELPTIVKIVEEKKEQEPPTPVNKVVTPTPLPDLKKVETPLVEKEPANGEIKINVQQTAKEISAGTPEINSNGISFQAIPTNKLLEPTRIIPPVAAPTLKVAPLSSVGVQGKTRMDDVKAAPRIMGPIEELRFLDLVSFRRLSHNPGEATAKIFAKIKLLEKAGYDRMTSGIAAWRQSETSHLYLKMCHDSAFQAKPLTEIIKSYQTKNEDYLTQEEIDSIMALNAKLLF